MMRGRSARLVLALTVVALGATLNACGGGGGRAQKEEKADLDQIVLPPQPLTIDTLWANNTGGGTDFLDIAVDGDLLLTVSTAGRFLAINSANGEIVWEHLLETRISAGAGGGDGLALAVDEEGVVYALNANDGSLRWQTRVAAEVLTPPAAAQGVAVVRTADGRVIGLSGDDGTQRWLYNKQEQGLSVRGNAPPVLRGGAVYNAFAGGAVVANEIASGKLLWQTELVLAEGGNEIERLADIDRRPLLTGKYLYAGSAYQGELVALDLTNTSAPLWRAAVSSAHDLAAAGERLYAVDGSGVAHAIHRLSGEILWSQQQMRGELASAPVVLGDYVLIAGAGGALYLLDGADGSVRGLIRGGAAAPVALRHFGGERAYLLRRNGELLALTPAGGS